MNTKQAEVSEGHPVVRAYRRYGVFGGVSLGLLLGVLLAGPRFFEWSAAESAALVAGYGAGGGLIGWFFLAISTGSIAGSGSWGLGSSGSGEGSDGGHGAGEGDGGGGGDG